MESNNRFIEETGFGYIVIDGVRYNYDVIVHVNGRITRRRKELSKPFKKGFHTPLALLEIEELLGEEPEVMVIGTGQFGALPVMGDVINELKRRGVEVIIDRTPRVIEIVNKLRDEGRRLIALLHVTC